MADFLTSILITLYLVIVTKSTAEAFLCYHKRQLVKANYHLCVGIFCLLAMIVLIMLINL